MSKIFVHTFKVVSKTKKQMQGSISTLIGLGLSYHIISPSTLHVICAGDDVCTLYSYLPECKIILEKTNWINNTEKQFTNLTSRMGKDNSWWNKVV